MREEEEEGLSGGSDRFHNPRHSAYRVLGLSPVCSAQEIYVARLKLTSFWSDRLTEGAATAAAMHAEKVCERIKECGNELSTPAMRLAYDLRHGFSQPLQRAKLSFSRR